MNVAPAIRRGLDVALELTVVGSFSRIGYAARRALFDWDTAPVADLSGRVAVVTGATSGLGLAAAHLLAERGADLVLVGRDEARTEAARRAILHAQPGNHIETVIADLASLDAVRAGAAQLARLLPRIDVLIHNAGLLSHELQRTDDGIELTAQVHVVAPFLLTAALLPVLRVSDTPRVITVSSGGMYTQRLDVDALETPPQPFDGVRAYANAKRAQVVLNQQWTQHAAARAIAFHAMHPGWADTPGVQSSLPSFRRVMRPILRTAEQGADTIAWLAGTPEALESNGDFWLDRHRRTTTWLPQTRTAPIEAERLWNWCLDRSGTRELIEAAS